MSESSPTYTTDPAHPRRDASIHVRRARELRIDEQGLRRLQTAIESVCGAESMIRRGLAGDSPRAIHTGLDIIRRELPAIADVLLFTRMARLRPEFSADFLTEVVDDLQVVEEVADVVELECSEQVRQLVELARKHLNRAATIIEENTNPMQATATVADPVREAGVAL